MSNPLPTPSSPTLAIGEPTRYVVYYRVSTQKQGRSGLGLDAQKAAINAFCSAHLIGEFIEIESGGKTSRTELAKAIELCKKQQAKLIAHRLDRVLRNLEILVALRINKVRFTALDCLTDSDMIINIKAAFAEDELRKISERTRAALAQKKARGFTLGKPENLTPDAQAKGVAGNVRRAALNENNRRAASMISMMRQAGRNYRQIAIELNRSGFRTAQGGQFQTTQVMRLAERLT